MIVGILTIQVAINDAFSLKDKRRVIKSLRERLGNKYNISIAEVDYNDVMRSSLLAIAMVGNDSRFINSALSKIVDAVGRISRLSLVDYTIEML